MTMLKALMVVAIVLVAIAAADKTEAEERAAERKEAVMGKRNPKGMPHGKACDQSVVKTKLELKVENNKVEFKTSDKQGACHASAMYRFSTERGVEASGKVVTKMPASVSPKREGDAEKEESMMRIVMRRLVEAKFDAGTNEVTDIAYQTFLDEHAFKWTAPVCKCGDKSIQSGGDCQEATVNCTFVGTHTEGTKITFNTYISTTPQKLGGKYELKENVLKFDFFVENYTYKSATNNLCLWVWSVTNSEDDDTETAATEAGTNTEDTRSGKRLVGVASASGNKFLAADTYATVKDAADNGAVVPAKGKPWENAKFVAKFKEDGGVAARGVAAEVAKDGKNQRGLFLCFNQPGKQIYWDPELVGAAFTGSAAAMQISFAAFFLALFALLF